ncbi:unnamed protein product [Trichogramma brassicae]|uniref:Uncharacterized protein n=1 Tax=Trichogramma brassicae TaxID=86971 RepID=A0A6H5HZC1_9HYME|nr:unnamed protein product [Trichogramma brassicae]
MIFSYFSTDNTAAVRDCARLLLRPGGRLSQHVRDHHRRSIQQQGPATLGDTVGAEIHRSSRPSDPQGKRTTTDQPTNRHTKCHNHSPLAKVIRPVSLYAVVIYYIERPQRHSVDDESRRQ